MKQKLRKFTNGFYPDSTNESDLEEMADKDSDALEDASGADNKDTVSRLSHLLVNVTSKTLPSDTHGEIVTELRQEISREQLLLTKLLTNVDNVTIYRVTKWSTERIEKELAYYKVQGVFRKCLQFLCYQLQLKGSYMKYSLLIHVTSHRISVVCN